MESVGDAARNVDLGNRWIPDALRVEDVHAGAVERVVVDEAEQPAAVFLGEPFGIGDGRRTCIAARKNPGTSR